MKEQFARTAMLLGEDCVNRLENAHVAVFGIGGVGGYVCEALARSGIGHFDLIDSDTVSVSNINRQIIATLDTVGRTKVDVMKERILSINREAEVNARCCFFLPETQDDFPFDQYDYVVDAVDTMAAKISLVMKAHAHQVPIICSMGAGNKLDGSRFKVADLFETTVDPLARVMRREMKKRGISRLKVVYSDEEPLSPAVSASEIMPPGKRSVPGSCAFVPSVAGLLIAGEVIKDLMKK